MATAKKTTKPFAAEPALTEEERRDLAAARKSSKERARRMAEEILDEKPPKKRRDAEERLDEEPSKELREELERERNMKRGEKAARENVGRLGFKDGGLVTSRGQGKVMRTRKTRMC